MSRPRKQSTHALPYLFRGAASDRTTEEDRASRVPRSPKDQDLREIRRLGRSGHARVDARPPRLGRPHPTSLRVAAGGDRVAVAVRDRSIPDLPLPRHRRLPYRESKGARPERRAREALGPTPAVDATEVLRYRCRFNARVTTRRTKA